MLSDQGQGSFHYTGLHLVVAVGFDVMFLRSMLEFSLLINFLHLHSFLKQLWENPRRKEITA